MKQSGRTVFVRTNLEKERQRERGGKTRMRERWNSGKSARKFEFRK